MDQVVPESTDKHLSKIVGKALRMKSEDGDMVKKFQCSQTAEASGKESHSLSM